MLGALDVQLDNAIIIYVTGCVNKEKENYNNLADTVISLSSIVETIEKTILLSARK